MNSKDTLDAIGRLPAGKALCQKDTRGDLTSHSDTDLTTDDLKALAERVRKAEGGAVKAYIDELKAKAKEEIDDKMVFPEHEAKAAEPEWPEII